MTHQAPPPPAPQPAHRLRFIYLYAISISLGGFLFGFALSQKSTILMYSEDPDSGSFYSLSSIYIYSVTIGATIGAAAGYPLIKYGRRRTSMAAAFLFTLTVFFQSMPIESAAYHIVIKLFMGVSIGYLSFICPLYLYEIAPPHERGCLIGIFQASILLGQFLIQAIQYWMKSYYTHTTHSKLGTSAITFSGAFVVSITFIFLLLFKYKYDTPQHYYSIERYDEARTSLSYFYKNDRIESKVYSFIK